MSGDQFIGLTQWTKEERENKIKCEPLRVEKCPNKAACCLTLNVIWMDV